MPQDWICVDLQRFEVEEQELQGLPSSSGSRKFRTFKRRRRRRKKEEASAEEEEATDTVATKTTRIVRKQNITKGSEAGLKRLNTSYNSTLDHISYAYMAAVESDYREPTSFKET